MLPLEWKISSQPVAYPVAVQAMSERVAGIRSGIASELMWHLEHPSLYTAGTSTRSEDVLDPLRCPVYKTGRGGQLTYHGPGQRVIYALLDLKTRNLDIRRYVFLLEQWLISTLTELRVPAERRAGRIGIWVDVPGKGECKVAAIGVRVQQGVSLHGVALNVDPDLSYYQGIVPCGLKGYGVTSLKELGIKVSFPALDKLLQQNFQRFFLEKGDYTCKAKTILHDANLS